MDSTDSSPAVCRVSLTEQSAVCEYGGGYELTLWSVLVDGEWLALADLVRSGPIGNVTARYGLSSDDLDESHDASDGFRNTPPGFAWIRDIQLEAPRGTQLMRRFGWPDRERARSHPLMQGVPRSWTEARFEIGGEGRIVSESTLRERAKRKASRQSTPMTRDEVVKEVDALLHCLDGSLPEPRRRRAPDPALLPPSFPSNDRIHPGVEAATKTG